MHNPHGYRPPTRPGILLRRTRKQATHNLASQPSPPTCDEHGVNLIEIKDADLPKSFDARLRDTAELFACPECFEGDRQNDIDVSKLGREIASNWNDYQTYFVNVSQPDMDRRGGTFEFR